MAWLSLGVYGRLGAGMYKGVWFWESPHGSDLDPN